MEPRRVAILGVGTIGESLLRGLISELLDLASITGGKMRLERAPHDLSDIVREAAEDLAPQAIEKGISLELRPATERGRMRRWLVSG